MIRRLIVGFTLGLVLLAAVSIAGNRPVVAMQTDPASEMLRQVNEYRASLGLPPFRFNGSLAAAAQNHANWMAETGIFSHTGAGGSSPLSRAQNAGFLGSVSENIVGGTQMSPRQGLIWWQNSPIHHNTLVSTRYNEAGTGYAVGSGQNMYVLVVGNHDPNAQPSLNNTVDNSADVLIITPIELAKPGDDGSIVHVMQLGQALWTVSAYYDVDLSFLYQINSLSEDDTLHPGDEVFVRLADGQTPPPTPTPPLTHTVQEGESAWSIAGQHEITLDFLYLLNNLKENSVLQPGDEVVIRLAEGQTPPPTPTPPVHHTIQAGESAWVIAALYELTVDELMSLNNLSVETVLRPGDQLQIRIPEPTPLPTELPLTLTPNSIADATGAETAMAMQSTSEANRTPRFSADISSREPGPLSTPIPDSGETSLVTGQSNNTGLIVLLITGLLMATGLVVISIRRLQR